MRNKLFSFITALFMALLFSSDGYCLPRTVPNPGCLDCFNFVAPSFSAAEGLGTTEIGLIVYDTYYNAFRAYTSGGWLKLSNERTIRSIAATATLTAAEDLVFVATATGAVVINLPISSSSNAGKIYEIKKIDSSANTVTITPNSSQLIDGFGSKILSGMNESISIISTGSGWVVTGRVAKAPTVTVKTSGSGTYTTPSGATLLKVKMVGGGAGGGGGGTGDSSAPTAGGQTYFGSSLLISNGGAAAGMATGGGVGGAATINSPAYGTAITGGGGGGGSGAINTAGGAGGSSCLGGNGGGGLGASGAPSNVAANSGSGGGGAGSPASGSVYSGNGGAAGGCVEAWIPNPNSTYAYGVGSAGTGGTASGTGARSGANGALGYIEITEYYQ